MIDIDRLLALLGRLKGAVAERNPKQHYACALWTQGADSDGCGTCFACMEADLNEISELLEQAEGGPVMTDTSKTKWTKGPWTVGFKGEFETHNPNIVYAENGDSVASVWGIPLHTTLEDLQRSGNTSDSEGMANARLIAKSPEMYDELFRALAVIRNPQAFDTEQVANDIERLLNEVRYD